MLLSAFLLSLLLAHSSADFSNPKESDATSRTHQICSNNSYTLVSNDGGLWPYRQYMTTNVTSPELLIHQSSPNVSEGLIFLTLVNSGLCGFPGVNQQGTVLMTSEGDLVWTGPEWPASNFLKQRYQGADVITVWTGAASSGGPAHGHGQVKVLNSRYETLHTVCPSASDLGIAAAPGKNVSCVADSHESYITERNTMLVTVYNLTQADLTPVGGPQNGWLTNSLAVEIDIETNEPLFIWNPLDHVPLNASKLGIQGSGMNSSDPYDWFHMNAIQSINGGYLINSRHTWSSYFDSKEGDIEWELNGKTGGSFGSLPPGYNFVRA